MNPVLFCCYWRQGLLGLLTLLAAPASLRSAQVAPGGAPALPPGFTQRTMLVWVVDAETTQPVAGAKVSNSTLYFVREADPARWQSITDARGEVQMTLFVPPQEIRRQLSDFTLSVEHANYASRVAMWRSDGGGALDDVPSEYTLRLSKGSVIGGVVQDEQGRPLPNAKIVVNGSSSTGFPVGTGAKRQQEFSQFQSGSFDPDNAPTLVTDQQGRWKVTTFPPDLDAVQVFVIRDDGSDATFSTQPERFGFSRAIRLVSLAELRSETAVFTLASGFTVRGRVLSAAGAPIAGAKVTEAVGMGNPQPRGRAITDAEGRFSFENRRARQVIWAVHAPGCALHCEVVAYQAGLPETVVRVHPAEAAVLRVTTEDGKPAAGATVQSIDWRNEGMYLNYRGITDGEGVLSWTNAPRQAVRAWVTVAGQPPRYVTLQSGRKEQLSMKAQASDQVTVRIRAVKATDQKPLEAFEVQLDREQTRQFATRTTGTNGLANVVLRQSDFRPGIYPQFLIRISAKGFLPADSEPLDFNEGDRELELALRPDTPIRGTVRLPDGTAADGAFVVVNRDPSPIFLNQQFQRGQVRPPSYGNLTKAETGADGAYVLEGVRQEAVVVAMHEEGYAQVPSQQLRENSTVTLRPWEQVEGVLKIGAQTAPAGHRVGLASTGGAAGLGIHFDATTDEEGQFVFGKVPAGTYRLFRYLDSKPGIMIYSHSQEIEVVAGKPARVQLGGRGVRIEGRARPSRYADLDWTLNKHILTAKPSSTSGDQPGPVWEDFVRRADFEAANRGRMNMGQPGRQYLLTFDQDGSFFIDDVEPGEYTLNIKVTEPPPGNRHWEEGKLIGALSTNVVIAVSQGKPSGLVNVGTFILPVGSGAPAAAMPPLLVQSLDGKTLEIGGKPARTQAILFWAPWSEQSCQALRQLQQETAATSAAKTLRIAVALEEDADEIQKAARAAGWTGELARLAGSELVKAFASHGVNEVPLLMVIDDRGGLVLKTSNSTRFAPALEEAAGASGPSPSRN